MIRSKSKRKEKIKLLRNLFQAHFFFTGKKKPDDKLQKPELLFTKTLDNLNCAANIYLVNLEFLGITQGYFANTNHKNWLTRAVKFCYCDMRICLCSILRINKIFKFWTSLWRIPKQLSWISSLWVDNSYWFC